MAAHTDITFAMHVYKVTANSLILAKAGVMLLQAARELTHMGVVWIHSNGGGGSLFIRLSDLQEDL